MSASYERLTDRDRQLLGVLAEARYLTTEQVRRLVFPGRVEHTVRRRLLALAGQGAVPLAHPVLRRLSYRTHAGGLVAVWALTSVGYLQAESVLGELPKVPKDDVGADFLEHSVALNELLVDLLATPLVLQTPPVQEGPALKDARARRARGAKISTLYARASHPAFRWEATDAVRLPWKEFDAAENVERARAIEPDGVLDLLGPKRRVFLECEMGGHSIAAQSDEKQGATLAKVARYAEYLSAFADVRARKTFYAEQYPDGFVPEVLFLVRKESRARSINEAIAGSRSLGARAALKARALTFEQAREEFLPLVGVVAPASPSPTPSPAGDGRLAVSLAQIELVQVFYRSVRQAYKAERDSARARHQPVPDYPRGLTEVHRLLADLGLERAS
jgi:hypothetical protein